MKKLGLWLLGATLPLALALTGCGATTAEAGVNTSAATLTTGPVTIATDHSAYANKDVMKITISNHLSTAIYAFDTQASCSILNLQIQQNGQWVTSNALRCPLGRAAAEVKIAPGGVYTTTIGATVMSIGSRSALADGTYRLVLNYFEAAQGSATPTSTATAIFSATLTVSGSVPPSNNQIPNATSMPNAPSGGAK